jgi:hypothetical protein
MLGSGGVIVNSTPDASVAILHSAVVIFFAERATHNKIETDAPL